MLSKKGTKIGGKRAGAGRKKEVRTIEKEKAREFIIAFVTARLEPLLNMLYKKALKGDVIAAKELFDRGYGKAPQAIEAQIEVSLKLDV